MSNYEQKDGTGSLFSNDQKETDRHPDFNGTITINGQQFYLSAWVKQKSGRSDWLSLSAKPKVSKNPAQDSKPSSLPRGKVESDDLNDNLDDIPF